MSSFVIGCSSKSRQDCAIFDPNSERKQIQIYNLHELLDNRQHTRTSTMRFWLVLSSLASASAFTTSPRSSRARTVLFEADETVFQRSFYTFSAGSDVAVHDSMVIEERQRWSQGQRMGPTTVLLRDGAVEDGEIGDEFFVLNVHGHTPPTCDLVTALYLASNPSLCQRTVLQVGCDLGLAGLLGAVGAGFVSRRGDDPEPDDVADDILTISQSHKGPFPKDLDMLTLTDTDDETLNNAFHNVKDAGIPPSRVAIEKLNWKLRGPRTARPPEYHTILASDLADTYPEAKELARTVAHRLEPSSRNIPPASFVLVRPEAREAHDLHKLLTHGYRMGVSTGYLKLEQLVFAPQSLPITVDESLLDDEPLELLDVRTSYYESMTALHHPDYVGEGEAFFPMENGEYDSASGATYMEPSGGGGGSWLGQ